MELMLNCENLELLDKYLDLYPIDGVTTNPLMLSKRKEKDYFDIIKSLRKAAGNRKLFTQVVSPVYEEMLEEAELIIEAAGKDTYVKIPANETGIKTIATLSARGINTLGTVVYSFLQGAMCLKAGAKYVAPFYEPMLYLGIDGDAVIRQLAIFIEKGGYGGKILAAGCRTSKHLGDLIEDGIHAVTVDPNFLSEEMHVLPSAAFQDMFIKNWESKFGAGVKIIDFKNINSKNGGN